MHSKGCRTSGTEGLVIADVLSTYSVQVFVVSASEPRIPIQIEDLSRKNDPNSDLPVVNLDTRLDNRLGFQTFYTKYLNLGFWICVQLLRREYFLFKVVFVVYSAKYWPTKDLWKFTHQKLFLRLVKEERMCLK